MVRPMKNKGKAEGGSKQSKHRFNENKHLQKMQGMGRKFTGFTRKQERLDCKYLLYHMTVGQMLLHPGSTQGQASRPSFMQTYHEDLK